MKKKNSFYINPQWIKQLNEWDGRLIVISGPKGVGKTSLSEELGYPLLQSVTTRERIKEYESYEFWSGEQFAEVERKRGFVSIVRYEDKKFGITKREWKRLSEEHKVIVTVMNPTSYKYLKSRCPRVIGLFVTAPRSTVYDRLKERDGCLDPRRVQAFDLNNKSKPYYHLVVKNTRNLKWVALTAKARLQLFQTVSSLVGQEWTDKLYPTESYRSWKSKPPITSEQQNKEKVC